VAQGSLDPDTREALPPIWAQQTWFAHVNVVRIDDGRPGGETVV
jgi:hypothetical protein